MSESDSTLFKFCTKCGCETERHKHGHCKPCTNARSNAWKAANKDRVKASREKWLSENADRYKEIRSDWLNKTAHPDFFDADAGIFTNRDVQNLKSRKNKASNPEREKARFAAWAKLNQNHERQRKAKWRADNLYKERLSHAKWRKENPEAVKLSLQNRRAKRKMSKGTLSKGLAERLMKLQRGKCACCGQPLGGKYHMDHIMPLALGGTNTDDNMQLLRATCNLRKNAKHPIDFMQQRGFLL